jgi:hypothetical protein
MKLILLILFLFGLQNIKAQGYLDTVTLKTCECVDQYDAASSQTNFQVYLGLCVINSSQPFMKQLEKQKGIKADDMNEGVKKIGEMVGERMVVLCPKSIEKITTEMSKESSSSAIAEATSMEVGTITAIDKNGFVIFTIKNEEGKSSKLYWLSEVQSDIDLITKFESLLNKQVEASYTLSELFDHKSLEYRVFKVLSSMNLKK